MGSKSSTNFCEIHLGALPGFFFLILCFFLKANLASSLSCGHFVQQRVQDPVVARLNLVISTPRLDLVPNSIENRKITYLIRERSTGEIVGVRLLARSSDGTNQTVGYIREGSENKGYAFESITLFLDLFFTQNPREVVTTLVHKNNYASAGLMRKVGFSHRGVTGPYDRYTLVREQLGENFSNLSYSTQRPPGSPLGLKVLDIFPDFGTRYGNNLRREADPFLNPPFVSLGVQKLKSFEREPGLPMNIEYVRNSETGEIYRKHPKGDWERMSETDFAEISRTRGFFHSFD